ncbi:hypothetical protein EMPS_07518 [Entomortierella parvispora]|uniref:EF-hand domain-containing protein n=1 Tax=Entomortierella parvispora TaxID=205924 RepID=A0A9P3LYS5_9FUNG|nr:hypothetical protein EMPS_07518 [Entomortierella parvispora]
MKFKRPNKKDGQGVNDSTDFSDPNIMANADSYGSESRREVFAQPLPMAFTSSNSQAAGYPFPATHPDQPIPPTAQLPLDVIGQPPSSAPTTPYDFITNSLHAASPEEHLDPKLQSVSPSPGLRGNGDGRVSSQQIMIEIDRVLKREDTNNDFIPPRQAMNTDESDFDWDEDINFDSSGQACKKKEKPRSCWRQLSPFLRMIILAILVEILMHTATETDPDRDIEARNQLRRVRKEAVVTIFTWLAFMWTVICITIWGIDFLPQLLVRFCSVFAPSRVETFKSKMLIFVATKKYVEWLLDACWAVGSFAVLTIVIFPIVSQQNWQTTLLKVLGALVALFALILVEKILLQIISTNFHQIAYADRIKENKYALSVLDRLGTSRKNVKRTKYQNQSQNRSQSRNPALNEKDPVNDSCAQRPRFLSTMPLPTSGKKHQQNISKGLNRKLHGLARADVVPAKDISSTENAKRLARMLFHNLQNHGEELVVKDFYSYFDTEEEAQNTFALFDKDGNGDISKREMKEKIFYVYKERKDLHTSLRDLSQAVGKLDIIFLTIVAVTWLLIILSIFGTSVVQNMLSIGSFLVALSFVFGNSLRTLFENIENIVFLFITSKQQEQNSTPMILVTCVTLTAILCTSPRGCVHAPVQDSGVEGEDASAKETKEFSPEMEIQIQEIDVKLKISMVIEHKGNWQESGRRWARRTKFHYALKEAMEDIGIRYYAVPNRLEIMQVDSCGSSISSGITMHSDGSGVGVGGSDGSSSGSIQQRNGPDRPQDHERANEDTLLASAGGNSGQAGPFGNYTPEQVARLYQRSSTRKPMGDAD